MMVSVSEANMAHSGESADPDLSFQTLTTLSRLFRRMSVLSDISPAILDQVVVFGLTCVNN